MTAVELPDPATRLATEPGVYELTDAAYFGGPLARRSLSSTGARELLNGPPAKFRYNQEHARPPKRSFDVGHAAHKLVLSDGPELVLFPGTGANPEAWQKKDDIADVAALRGDGKVPLKPSDWDKVHAMAAELRQHPHAPLLLSRGAPERSMVWRDEATGVLCRAKADWLRPDGVVDYKTTDNGLSDQALTKSVHEWGYYIQAPFYLRGFRALHPGTEPFFGFIVQEKDPPYLVRTVQLTERAMAYGDRKCAEAMALYAACVEAGEWPGYPTDDIPEIDLPAWVRTEEY